MAPVSRDGGPVEKWSKQAVITCSKTRIPPRKAIFEEPFKEDESLSKRTGISDRRFRRLAIKAARNHDKGRRGHRPTELIVD
jgi:hypothetical protein